MLKNNFLSSSYIFTFPLAKLFGSGNKDIKIYVSLPRGKHVCTDSSRFPTGGSASPESNRTRGSFKFEFSAASS